MGFCKYVECIITQDYICCLECDKLQECKNKCYCCNAIDVYDHPGDCSEYSK